MTTNEKAKEKFRQGASLLASGDFEASVQALSEAIEHDPHFELAYRTRGAANMKMSRPTEAVSDFAKALEIEPSSPRVYHLRGLAYHQAGDSANAVEDFSKAIELDPEYGVAYLSRANLQEELGNEEAALRDREMVAVLGKLNIGKYSADNNIWEQKNMPS